MTPHPNQQLTAVLGRPIMDRRYKYSVFESTASASNATSALPGTLVAISQGTTDITRTGDRVRAKRIWLSGKIVGNAAATGPVATRVLVVCWNPNGPASVNVPTAAMVAQGSAGYLPFAAYSRDFGDSYQVVYDVVLNVNPASTTQPAVLFHYDRKVTIDMEFTAGATVPTTNALYLFLISDTGVNQPSISYQSTLWYEDLDA